MKGHAKVFKEPLAEDVEVAHNCEKMYPMKNPTEQKEDSVLRAPKSRVIPNSNPGESIKQ